MLTAIVNVNESWGIGAEGDLLCSIPEDMKFFRETTRGSVVIMGRKTLFSFPGSKALKGRMNLVFTRDSSQIPAESSRPEDPSTTLYPISTIEDLQKMLTSEEAAERKAFVIGGEQIYRKLLPLCEECLVTRNDCSRAADAWFPNLDADPEWELSIRGEDHEYEGIHYHFDTYRRVR